MNKLLLLTGVALSMMASLTLNGASSDSLLFITGGALNSNDVLSTNANNPTTVFEGVSLDDYEPAYVYFAPGSSSGSKYWVCTDLHNEILRPYYVVRATENGAATMTVQFQGVTRTKQTPYTASVTVKFRQSGDNIVAYVVRAASLKPLDIELGLDLNAMVDSGNSRAMARPLYSRSGREEFNISVIAMRKPAATVALTPHNGDTVKDTLAGNGAVTVALAAADTTTYNDYLPNNTWVVVAENHDLADLDEVSGFYHYATDTGYQQTAYNLHYTAVTDNLGVKTCQFQSDAGNFVRALVVEFRQNGANVEARSGNTSGESSRWKRHSQYIYKESNPDIVLGVDFEKYTTATTPRIYYYNSYATGDTDNAQGVKNMTLKFRSRPTVVRDGYLPNGYADGVNFWTVVAENHSLSDLVEVDAYYHRSASSGGYMTGVNLKNSGNSGSCQIQWVESSFLTCIGIDLRQSGNNIEARTGKWNNWYIYYSGHESEVVYGMDFYQYNGSTTPARTTYNSYSESDDGGARGIKNLRMRFKTGGITYAAASTAQFGNDLAFSGSADAPLAVKTTASTVFPSNGVIKVEPYTTLTLDGHVGNDRWTQYRVMTNGTLKLKGTWQTGNFDPIDLVGGTLFMREGESGVKDSGSYISYLTLMNGAHCKGAPARVGHAATSGNWIVAGDAPSYCESGLLLTATGGSAERTFTFNVNDVSEGSDFIVSGPIADYHTLYTSETGYWNVHAVKDGAGTMEVSGDIQLPNEICVNNGALCLAGNDQFKVSRKRTEDGSNAKAAIWLAGGALETAAGTTNTTGEVVAKVKDAPLNLGNGSKLTLSSFSFDTGANLLVSDNLGKGATLRIEGLTPEQRGRIRCGADRMRVREDANGNLEPYVAGMVISVK